MSEFQNQTDRLNREIEVLRLLNEGNLAKAAGDLPLAERAYNEILERFDPDNNDAKVALINLLRQGGEQAIEAGRLDAAEDYFAKWVKLDPESTEAGDRLRYIH